MEQLDIILLLQEAKKQIEKVLKELSPEECSCHERDSSQVCSVCYKRGMRGHMEEGGESKFCDNCYLWSNSTVCDFCNGPTKAKERRRY